MAQQGKGEYGRDRQSIVKQYFATYQDIRSGNEAAVDQMLELWDEDGAFAVAGPPPASSDFRGEFALRALFKSVAASRGDGGKVELDDVEVRGDKAIARWTARAEGGKASGLAVAGAITFHFKGDKIRRVDLVTSLQPAEGSKFSVKDLSVTDIGRLALAAWAVV